MSLNSFRLVNLRNELNHQQRKIISLLGPYETQDYLSQYRSLRYYIDDQRKWYLENAEIHFNSDFTSCEVSFSGVWSCEISDLETLEMLYKVQQAGEGINDFELEWMAPDDDEILGELPLIRNAENELEMLEFPSRSYCFALLAFHYNSQALSLVSAVLDAIAPEKLPVDYHAINFGTS